MSLTNATPLDIAQAARLGSRKLAVLSTDQRNAALTAIHQALAEAKDEVLAANVKDLEAANKAAAGGTLSASLVKRLDLSKPGKYEDMLQGILDVRELGDPSMLYIPHLCRLQRLIRHSQQNHRKDTSGRQPHPLADNMPHRCTSHHLRGPS
jgi:gamma-glutamyl phosphate reductase